MARFQVPSLSVSIFFIWSRITLRKASSSFSCNAVPQGSQRKNSNCSLQNSKHRDPTGSKHLRHLSCRLLPTCKYVSIYIPSLKNRGNWFCSPYIAALYRLSRSSAVVDRLTLGNATASIRKASEL